MVFLFLIGSHYALTDINKSRVSIIHVDRRWHGYRLATRNGSYWLILDITGYWDYTELPPCPGLAVPVTHSASAVILSETLGPARHVVPSFVNVEFHLPFKIDGVAHQVHAGIGLVLDSKLGLVVTDRNAVPTSIGDVLLTFSNSIIISAQVLYLHQVYNYAIVKYDPKLLGDTFVKDAVISDIPVKQNDSGKLTF